MCAGPTWTQKSLCTCVVFPRAPPGPTWIQRLLHVCVYVCLSVSVFIYACVCAVSKDASWSHLDSEAPLCVCVCVVFLRQPPGLRGPCMWCVCVSEEASRSPWTQRLLRGQPAEEKPKALRLCLPGHRRPVHLLPRNRVGTVCGWFLSRFSRREREEVRRWRRSWREHPLEGPWGCHLSQLGQRWH